MFKKLMTAALITTGTLAIALPAGATTTKPETASFGTNGYVTMHNAGKHWDGRARFVGLSTGQYQVEVHQWVYDSNGNLAGGVTDTLCTFKVQSGHVARCSGRTEGDLLGGGWTPNTTAELVKVSDGTGESLGERTFAA
jgi:hypothetical protein